MLILPVAERMLSVQRSLSYLPSEHEGFPLISNAFNFQTVNIEIEINLYQSNRLPRDSDRHSGRQNTGEGGWLQRT